MPWYKSCHKTKNNKENMIGNQNSKKLIRFLYLILFALPKIRTQTPLNHLLNRTQKIKKIRPLKPLLIYWSICFTKFKTGLFYSWGSALFSASSRRTLGLFSRPNLTKAKMLIIITTMITIITSWAMILATI